MKHPNFAALKESIFCATKLPIRPAKTSPDPEVAKKGDES